MFHYTVETDKTMEKAIQSIEENLKHEQFGVLWQFDIQKTLQNKGLEFDDPFVVLEVCNPNEAQNILSKNKMVGYFLPCKVVVYEEEGKTKIGMPKPTELIQMVKDEELMETARSVEARIIKAINQSV